MDTVFLYGILQLTGGTSIVGKRRIILICPAGIDIWLLLPINLLFLLRKSSFFPTQVTHQFTRAYRTNIILLNCKDQNTLCDTLDIYGLWLWIAIVSSKFFLLFICFITPDLKTLQWHQNGRDDVSNHQPHDCLLNRLFRRRSKKISKLRIPGLFAGNSPVTVEFPTQMASNAENVSIWWRHHDTFHAFIDALHTSSTDNTLDRCVTAC